MQFRNHTLDNGLEIVAECNEQAYSASFAFYVRTGSRDETTEISGVSHFLEHMVFKGTPTRTSVDVNRQLDELSSNSNAYTNEEQTVYYATVLPETQGQIVELLADVMRPSLRQEDFDTEKQVILEEIAKYDDQPPYGGHEKCMAAHYGPHPLGRSVLGTTESVSALTQQQMLAYFMTRYSPRNIVLAAAGNVDFPGLIATAQKQCGSWEPFEAPREILRPPPNRGFKVLHKPQATQQYVIQVANGPGADEEDRYAARLLGMILGDDSGSRLFWELVDTGLAEYAAIGSHEFQGTGLFMAALCSAPEQTAENLQRLSDLIHEIEANGVTEEELKQAQNKICAHIVLQSERPSNRLSSVGNGWVQRRQYRTVRQGVDAYRAVTLEDISRVLAKYPLSMSTTIAIGPLTELPEPS